MSETIYEVSIVERQPDGRNDIRVLLKTTDLEKANFLVGSLEQDGQRAKLTVVPPAGKKR
jgi:hypothetical protein